MSDDFLSSTWLTHAPSLPNAQISHLCMQGRGEGYSQNTCWRSCHTEAHFFSALHSPLLLVGQLKIHLAYTQLITFERKQHQLIGRGIFCRNSETQCRGYVVPLLRRQAAGFTFSEDHTFIHEASQFITVSNLFISCCLGIRSSYLLVHEIEWMWA